MIVSLPAESTSRVELRSGPSWTREDRAKCRLATMAELLERSSSKNQRTSITWKKFSFYSPLAQTAPTYKVLYTEKKKSPFCFAQNWSTSNVFFSWKIFIPLFFQSFFMYVHIFANLVCIFCFYFSHVAAAKSILWTSQKTWFCVLTVWEKIHIRARCVRKEHEQFFQKISDKPYGEPRIRLASAMSQPLSAVLKACKCYVTAFVSGIVCAVSRPLSAVLKRMGTGSNV